MKNKKIIVIVIPDLKGNGAERVMLSLAAGLQQNNWDVHIVIFKEIIELKYDGNINIHVFKKHFRWIPRSIRGLVLAPILDNFIIRYCGKPDLVLSNLLPIDRLLAYSKLNSYFVIHNTMSLELKSYDRKFKELINIYTRKPAICVSKGVQNDFTRLFKSSKEVQTIYNPIDVDFIQKMVQGNDLISRDLINLGDYIVHVGKFSSQKRHDILIKAYKKSKVKMPLVLVGKGSLQDDIKALVQELNLGNKVIFLGFQTNPYPIIKNAKLMVFSSDFEGLGMVILEAMALNVPVISTNCPSGPAEILPSQHLCPVGSVQKLAQLIKQATNNPHAFIQPLDKKFDLDFSTKKYIDLI